MVKNNMLKSLPSYFPSLFSIWKILTFLWSSKWKLSRQDSSLISQCSPWYLPHCIWIFFFLSLKKSCNKLKHKATDLCSWSNSDRCSLIIYVFLQQKQKNIPCKVQHKVWSEKNYRHSSLCSWKRTSVYRSNKNFPLLPAVPTTRW